MAAQLPHPTHLRSLTEVADQLGVSTKTVRRLVASGDLTAIRFCRRLKFDPADIEAFIDSRRPAPSPAPRPRAGGNARRPVVKPLGANSAPNGRNGLVR